MLTEEQKAINDNLQRIATGMAAEYNTDRVGSESYSKEWAQHNWKLFLKFASLRAEKDYIEENNLSLLSDKEIRSVTAVVMVAGLLMGLALGATLC